MTTIAPHIHDLITACDEMLKNPSLDKRAVRRTKSALETAYYCALGITATERPNAAPGASPSVTEAGINVTQPVGNGTTSRSYGSSCICAPGTRNRSCAAITHNS